MSSELSKACFTERPPRHWVAALWALLSPGWGHFYLGCWRAGLIWLLLWRLLEPSECLLCLALGPGPAIFWVTCTFSQLLPVLLYLAQFYDALRRARTVPLRPRVSGLLFAFLSFLLLSMLSKFSTWLQRHHRYFEKLAIFPSVYRMRGNEMGDAVQYLDDYLVNVYDRSPHYGELIAYQSKEGVAVSQCQVVARVAGLSGDKVEGRETQMIRNGTEVSEPWLESSSRGGANMPLIEVPPGHYLCLYDERWFRYETPYWELLPQERVLGKVALIIDSVNSDRVGLDPLKGGGLKGRR